ncbi:MAG: hypothetical protein M3M94_04430 [Actinomycetota bacterium]|nr:hypothetical protein [Actinomycetota bacterium]
MAVDLAAQPARASALTPALARAAAVPAGVWLAGIVAVSAAVRFVAALPHVVPLYFPDEYIYSSLARSLATSGRPLVRDVPASFPALLEPLLTAPFWLLGDPQIAFRLTQALNVVAMSLAAVPVYYLCRRLGLGKSFGLGAAGIAVTCPDVFFASFVLSDPIAYPLVLGALLAGVSALARPTRRSQVAFLALSGLACFARVQYVILPLVFLAAAVVVERGHVLRAARRFWLTLVLLGAPLAVLTALGPTRLLGYYAGISDNSIRAGAALHWIATDAMLLAYSAGWVLVPGALVGLALALIRPATREASAFAALTVFLALALFLEAGLYATNGADRFQERYLFVLLPLAAPAFGLLAAPAFGLLAAGRGIPRLSVALIAVALLAVAARLPLAPYTVADEKQDSPLLFAVFELERTLGAGNGSLLVAGLAAACSLLAAACAFRPRRLVGPALAVTMIGGAAISAGASAFDAESSRLVRTAQLPRDVRWIDHSGLDEVALLHTAEAPPGPAHQNLFWNRSVTTVVRGEGAGRIDLFDSPRARVLDDGRLLVRGSVLRRPLLVHEHAVNVALGGARRVARGRGFVLWRPVGTPRLSFVTNGRYRDGWLAREGEISVWPDATKRAQGTVSFALSLPRGAPRTSVRLEAPGIIRTLRLTPGSSRNVRIGLASRSRWTLRFRTTGGTFLPDGRAVSVKATRPSFDRR